jgi:hypothetical protein
MSSEPVPLPDELPTLSVTSPTYPPAVMPNPGRACGACPRCAGVNVELWHR